MRPHPPDSGKNSLLIQMIAGRPAHGMTPLRLWLWERDARLDAKILKQYAASGLANRGLRRGYLKKEEDTFQFSSFQKYPGGVARRAAGAAPHFCGVASVLDREGEAAVAPDHQP